MREVNDGLTKSANTQSSRLGRRPRGRTTRSQEWVLAIGPHQWVQEFEQLLCGRVVRQTEVGIELVVGCLLCAKHFDGNVGSFKHGAEASCLRGDVGVPGNVENQERRDALALRHMRYG